jgi:hypothetical protein
LTPSPPPPRHQKNFGQCTILGVQKFFGHTKIFRNIILIFQIFRNLTEFVPFFLIISQYCPTVERILPDWLCLPNKLPKNRPPARYAHVDTVMFELNYIFGKISTRSGGTYISNYYFDHKILTILHQNSDNIIK